MNQRVFAITRNRSTSSETKLENKHKIKMVTNQKCRPRSPPTGGETGSVAAQRLKVKDVRPAGGAVMASGSAPGGRRRHRGSIPETFRLGLGREGPQGPAGGIFWLLVWSQTGVGRSAALTSGLTPEVT